MRQGPRLEDGGVRFILYSGHATAVDLVIFDAAGRRVLPMRPYRGNLWSIHVPGAGDGTLYGFLVDGPWVPGAGHLFNPRRLLVDPYARALTGKHAGRFEEHLGYDPHAPGGRVLPNARDNIDLAPRSVVVDHPFDWGGDARPEIPMRDLVIYEMHARGFTRHPSSAVRRPGTFLGVAEKIPHLVDLGVNAVELMPVMESMTERKLAEIGLVNYWGYNPIALFAPDVRFASGDRPGCQVDEFKTMVRELHAAGIEVILDIVFNHTGEVDELGPTVGLRGIDNAAYYRLRSDDPSRCVNWTGCGNTLDFTEQVVRDMCVDCLAYWAGEMHADGFRFDLAPVVGRNERGEFDPGARFFEAVASHPDLAGVKLIAEPWDAFPGGPSVQGRFPAGWSEWNGTCRTTLRRFARGEGGTARAMASCLDGSPGLFADPCRSVNYATSHDGFTLHDLVGYEVKRNEANGEGNRDGEADNLSWNCGAEGPTGDASVLAMRGRQARNILTMLLACRGVPMILSGDEMLRSQGGNNNAYCQDSEISWIDWSLVERSAGFLSFARTLLAHRGVLVQDAEMRAHASLEDAARAGAGALVDAETRSLAFSRGTVFVALNAHWEPRTFPLPDPPPGTAWHWIVDTDRPAGMDIMPPGAPRPLHGVRGEIHAGPRSVLVLVAEATDRGP